MKKFLKKEVVEANRIGERILWIKLCFKRRKKKKKS